MHAIVRLHVLGLVLLTNLMVAGCGSREEKKPATQVAAKVNSEEITVHQINNVLARTQSVPPERSRELSKQILERLIDQELLVQKARERKLERDPKVLQAIEASQREILARAYLEQVAGGAVKPTPQDIADYYGKHPELFRERRIYNLRELAVGIRPDQAARLQEELSKAKSMNDIAEWLRSQNIPFNASQGVKAAEQLPLEVVARFHQLRDGQVALLPTPSATLIVQLVSSQTQPLDEAKAAPFIEQYLVNQKRAELADKEVKALRAAGKIEYVGEFAKAEGGASQQPSQAAEASRPAGQAAAGASPATAPGVDPKSIEKGVAGLK